jgi:hypothetical protein
MTMLLRIFSTFYLLLMGLLLLACGPSTTPTPDLVATQVAVEKAAAATLTAEAPTEEADSAPQTSPPEETVPTPTSTLIPAPQPADDTIQSAELTETPSPSPLCTVVTEGLNLRTGPGTVYEPPLGAMPQGMALIPLAFNPIGFPNGQWLQVEAQDSGQTGWVSAGPQFVECNVDVTGLPPGIAPPTPTPIPTPTAIPPTNTPPPTPTRPLFALVPVDGGQSDLEGQIIIPGFTLDGLKGPEYDGVIFRDRLVFQVEVYDPNRGNHDGAGIEKVNIKIFDPDGNKVHERTENNAGYCVFGGGEPDCNVFRFDQNNYRWPEEGQPAIENGRHSVQIDITAEDNQTETWNWSFWIQKNN